MLYGYHGYPKAYDMAMATMYAYPPSQNALPHCNFVLSCCANLQLIDPPSQESDRHHSNMWNKIRFHVYHLIERCLVHGRQDFDEKKKLFVFVLSLLCATHKTIHNKRSCYDGDIYFWLSYKFLHSIGTKFVVSPP